MSYTFTNVFMTHIDSASMMYLGRTHLRHDVFFSGTFTSPRRTISCSDSRFHLREFTQLGMTQRVMYWKYSSVVMTFISMLTCQYGFITILCLWCLKGVSLMAWSKINTFVERLPSLEWLPVEVPALPLFVFLYLTMCPGCYVAKNIYVCATFFLCENEKQQTDKSKSIAIFTT